MRRGIFVALAGFVAVGMTITPAVATAPADPAQLSQFPTTELNGVVVPLGAEEEEQLRREAMEILDGTGIDPPDRALLYIGQNGREYVLLTDREPRVARASGPATLISDGAKDGPLGLLLDRSVQFDQDGRSVPYADLKSNPEQYRNNLVEVSGTVRELSYTVDAAENRYVIQRSFYTLAPPGASAQPFGEPGRNGRFVSLNLSGSEYGGSRVDDRFSKASQRGPLIIGGREQRVSWWQTGTVTVTAVVRTTNDGGAYLVTGPVDRSTTGVALQSLSERRGEVVTVTGSGVGTAISTQETLLSTAQCAPTSVTNPVTGCLPIPADAVVHIGVLVDSGGTVQPYVGISNVEQSQATKVEAGRYRVTGRVVGADRVDPRLSGTALVVYSRERTGSFAAGANARTRAAGDAERLKNYIQEQQTSTRSEWAAIQKQATKTPTPKPTPTPTSTVTVTTTSSLSATDTPRPSDTSTGGTTGPPIIGPMLLFLTPFALFGAPILVLGAVLIGAPGGFAAVRQGHSAEVRSAIAGLWTLAVMSLAVLWLKTVFYGPGVQIVVQNEQLVRSLEWFYPTLRGFGLAVIVTATGGAYLLGWVYTFGNDDSGDSKPLLTRSELERWLLVAVGIVIFGLLCYGAGGIVP